MVRAMELGSVPPEAPNAVIWELLLLVDMELLVGETPGCVAAAPRAGEPETEAVVAVVVPLIALAAAIIMPGERDVPEPRGANRSRVIAPRVALALVVDGPPPPPRGPTSCPCAARAGCQELWTGDVPAALPASARVKVSQSPSLPARASARAAPAATFWPEDPAPAAGGTILSGRLVAEPLTAACGVIVLRTRAAR